MKRDILAVDDIRAGRYAHSNGQLLQARVLITWCEAVRRLCV
jgi:hypothetical protein